MESGEVVDAVIQTEPVMESENNQFATQFNVCFVFC